MKPEILFIGLPLLQAKILASRLSYDVRVVDSNTVVTNDLVNTRINLVVENDVVVESYFG